MKSYENFRGDCKITTWLCQIAKHSFFLYEKHRKRNIDLNSVENEIVDTNSIEILLGQREQAFGIHKLLHNLPEPYKEVFSLRVLGELSYQDMATLGNRPDLFPDSPYVNKYITGKPGDYEVPGEYLDDETFAAMLAEAQKYIGYPYVWGGSSPATSFDCSGYVSWVINHSGWNVGRLGAQGLYNICTPTSSPKPGDLVFFKGTYDTPGVSHCGIYVGDGKMLHCGDPIGYANLNTSYWQSHFYAYGRLP